MKSIANKNESYPLHFPPRIVIKFRDTKNMPYHEKEKIQNYFLESNLIPWKEIVKKFPGIGINKLFTSCTPERIEQMVKEILEKNKKYITTDFLTYFSIECTEQMNTEELLEILLKCKKVEYAYLESDPNLTPANPGNPIVATQGYLNRAPEGIDAKYAWTFNGGQGQGGVQIIDIEKGWILDHDDYAASNVGLLWGENIAHFAWHGTAVLGVLLMQNREIGASGITPLVKASVISQINPDGRNGINDGIMKAIDILGYGDVLLLEIHVKDHRNDDKRWPAEILPATFDAIKMATAKGIVVIEAAGNGNESETLGNKLDDFLDGNDKFVLDPNSSDFKDSDAIMVAAAKPSREYRRRRSSNYGNRIDCFSWGLGIFTTNVQGYNENFNNTSGASAIIAGAAIAVQGILKAAGKPRLNSRQMRNLLRNDRTGTSSIQFDDIRVMPDLKRIIDSIFSGSYLAVIDLPYR